MREDTLLKLNTTVTEIFDLVPHTCIDKTLHAHAERALLPFMAGVSNPCLELLERKT